MAKTEIDCLVRSCFVLVVSQKELGTGLCAFFSLFLENASIPLNVRLELHVFLADGFGDRAKAKFNDACCVLVLSQK